MHTLHLIGAEPGKAIQTIKGIRAATAKPLKEAKLLYDEFLQRGFALLCEDYDIDVIEDARAKLVAASNKAAVPGVDLADEHLETLHDAAAEAAERPDEPGDIDFGLAVQRTALTLMAAANGNPMAAGILAASLHRSTKDDLYAAIADVLEGAFPDADIFRYDA